MLITDLTVEIRDSNLNRVGQIMPTELVGSTFISRFNNVGSWTLNLPNGSDAAELLRTPGYGLILTGVDGVIISGNTIHATLVQSTADVVGYWEISGIDDSALLSDRLAYPEPTNASVDTQSVAYDNRSGNAETVLKEYVDANISATAGTIRAIPYLTVETDEARGLPVSAAARFETLQSLFYPVAAAGGIGYTIEQSGSDLEFQVYEPVDRSSTIRMDLANNKLTKTQYDYANPRSTRVIVGGAGEAEERVFYEGTTAESLAAETLWKRRIETFLDNRGSADSTELIQKADEYLIENGVTGISVAVTPTDNETMRYGYDWGLGDRVTVVIDETESTAVVTAVGISIQADGVRVSATLGTPVLTNFDSKIIAKIDNQETRISNIERNTTGNGVDTIYQPSGGTSSTQPVFPASAIEGSYTRFGNLIHFAIKVTFTDITSFGTGQYYLTLPYPAIHPYDLRDGCLHDDSTSTQYQISGHVVAGSDELWLSAADKVGASIQDVAFTSTNPVTLTTADSFHIAGTIQIA
jgi:hypothetical protein